MFPPGLEPGTFRVLGERDNHYTTETWRCQRHNSIKLCSRAACDFCVSVVSCTSI